MTDPATVAEPPGSPAPGGWTVVTDLFGADECAAIRAASDDRFWPVLSPALAAWVLDPRWAPHVCEAVGPDVLLLREQVVTKNPHSDADVPWHQDDGYTGVRPPGFLTCFLALEDIAPSDGCLWVLPASHRRGVLAHRQDGYLRCVDDAAAGAIDEGSAVAVPLRRGSALLLSSLLLHRSLGNHGDGFRPAWIVQFCAADATDADGRSLGGLLRVARDGRWVVDAMARPGARGPGARGPDGGPPPPG